MSFNLPLYLDIFIYKTAGIKSPNIIKIGTTKDKSHLICTGVMYKYETSPWTQKMFDIFLYDNNEIKEPIMSG